jgi:hypothetical protein
MNTTLKALSALTIATAALAATALPSSALPSGPVGTYLGSAGRHGLLPAQPPKATLPPAIKNFGGLINRKPLGSLFPRQVFNCLACNLPHPTPVGPKPVNGHGDNWGYGWNHGYGWNRGYGWRDRPEILVEGRQEAVMVGSPVPSAPQFSAAPQAAAEPCNCLTKQSLPDGSVLFQDICTKESALAAPVTVGAR